MSVDIGEPLQAWVEWVATQAWVEQVTTQARVVFVGIFALAGFANTVAENSPIAAALQWVRTNVDFRDYYAELPAWAYSEMVRILEADVPLAYVDAPVPVILGPIVAIWAPAEFVGIGAIRWFAEKQSGGLAAWLFVRRVVWTVVNLFVGGLIYFLVVALGFAFFASPGSSWPFPCTSSSSR